MSSIIDEFEIVVIDDPADVIIRQIRTLIRDGKLSPGDKLPSEAKLQQKFQVKRGAVREALKKLEFYGVLKTKPQSGTVVANLGIQTLEGLLSNILKLERDDYESLVDTRRVLEGRAAALAAERADDDARKEIKELERLYELKAGSGERGLSADISFHLRIASAAQSSVLTSLITMISPDVLSMFGKLDRISDDRLNNSIAEHKRILKAILEKKPEEAEQAMRDHIQQGYLSSKT